MTQQLFLTTKIWKEGKSYIAFNPELEVASQGKTREQAEKNLREAVKLFLDTARKKGGLEQILRESGFVKEKRIWQSPLINIYSLPVRI